MFACALWVRVWVWVGVWVLGDVGCGGMLGVPQMELFATKLEVSGFLSPFAALNGVYDAQSGVEHNGRPTFARQDSSQFLFAL